MKTIELKVSGMTCGHCLATVKSALAVVPGVSEVDVLLAEGRARVRADDGVTEAALVEAVRRTGYGADPAR